MPGCQKGDLAIIRGLGPKSNGHFVTCVKRLGMVSAVTLDGRPMWPDDLWEVTGPWVLSRMAAAASMGIGRTPVLPDRVLFPIRGDRPGKEDSEVYKLGDPVSTPPNDYTFERLA